jgi:prophage DNA circulation protein
VSELRFARSTEFSDAATAVAQALLAATTDPADAIRLLLPLTEWGPQPLPGSGPLWITAQAIQDALTSNVRCAACAALAQASALYRPISYQDAQAIRLLVCGALDDEATRCADAGRDASYQALRTLFWAVALDLSVRGANLPVLIEVTTLVSMPSLAEAWMLYQDTTREPDLVASSGAPHPLFLPLNFPALSR